jgi:RNA polymerase sporulation-specific sigma factor
VYCPSEDADRPQAARRNDEGELIILYSEKHILEGGKQMKKWKLRLSYYWYKILIKLGLKTDEVYYIGGSEALPPPLSKDEEEMLLKKLPGGDKAARSILIERNLRLVVYIARKFENTGINIEDLISIGTIGLIKAVNTFNPEKKIKLATYASRCIENEILMYLRRNNKIRSEVSFDEPLNIDWDGNELLLSDVLGTEDDIITKDLEANVDRKLLTKALHQLSEREKQIMELRFGLTNGEEKTQKDVADMLGISQSYISRLEKRIIKRLRKEFNKMV